MPPSQGGGRGFKSRSVHHNFSAVVQEFFERNFRKLGFLLTNEEVIETMKEKGFRDISDRRVDSTYIISGRK